MTRIDLRSVTVGRFALLVVSLMSATASAESYTVQIAAHAHPDTARVASAEAVAPVSSWMRDDGVTLYFAGEYETVASANQARNRLRELGYVDAFVKLKGVKAAAQSEAPGVAMPVDDLERLRQGRAGELVILDGVPHIKNGNDFTPLRDVGA